MPNALKNSRSAVFNRIMFVLAIVGVLIAVYVFQSFVRKTPIICVNSGCELVRKNPASYLFGVPVPGYGLIGYLLLVFLTFLRTMSAKVEKQLLPVVVGITTGGVLFVAWFTYTELFIIRAFCTWCAVSAIIMTILSVLAWKSYILQNNETHR